MYLTSPPFGGTWGGFQALPKKGTSSRMSPSLSYLLALTQFILLGKSYVLQIPIEPNDYRNSKKVGLKKTIDCTFTSESRRYRSSSPR